MILHNFTNDRPVKSEVFVMSITMLTTALSTRLVFSITTPLQLQHLNTGSICFIKRHISSSPIS